MKIIIELAPEELTDELIKSLRGGAPVTLPPVEKQAEIVKTIENDIKKVDIGTGVISGSPTPKELDPVSVPQGVTVEPSEIPSGNPTVTLEDIKVAAANLLASGKVQKKDLQELNAMFSIRSLLELKPEQFADYCQTLRGLGAVI